MTLSAFITSMLFLSLVLSGAGVLLSKPRFLRDVGISILLLPVLLAALRLFVPLELPFAKTVGLSGLYTGMIRGFTALRLDVFGYSLSAAHVAGIVWAFGCIVVCVHAIFMHLRFFSSIRADLYASPPSLKELLAQCESEFGYEHKFELLQSDKIASPAVTGFFKPTILIPPADLSAFEWKLIFRHEIAHHHFGDLWIRLLLELIRIIYWWNPVIYFFRRQALRALEMRVDLSIYDSLPPAGQVEYMECLLKFSRKSKARSTTIAAYSEYASAASITRRFHLMVQEKSKSRFKRASKAAATVLFLVLSLLLSVFVVFEPYGISEEDAAGTYELSINTSYLVVNGDGYDLYMEGQFAGTVKMIPELFKDMPIYNTLEEAYDETQN